MTNVPDRIYLDHAATTPLCPEARAAMEPWLGERFGNPSSMHAEGREARAVIDEARATVAEVLGCAFADVVFTSSGTEAANLAVLGTALRHRGGPRKRILWSAIEHHCVQNTEPALRAMGCTTEAVPVTRQGFVDLHALRSQIDDDVLLVAVMHANNELGTIQPVREVANLAHERFALFFCDAVQTFAIGGVWKGVDDLDADLVAVSSHKVHGPKGVGALYVRPGVKPSPILLGGGQEREMRAGTENVAGIVGFAAALRSASLVPNSAKRAARDRFLEVLRAQCPEPPCVTVEGEHVLPGHAHLRFEGIGAESMLIVLDLMGVAASSGAACSSGSLEASHVLLACGYSDREAREGLRFTFGRDAGFDEAEEAARRVAKAVAQIRRPSTW